MVGGGVHPHCGEMSSNASKETLGQNQSRSASPLMPGGFNQVEQKKGGWISTEATLLTAQGGRVLIKKFNSTTAAPASQHSEVRPCEAWRRLIRRRQILWSRGARGAQLKRLASGLLGARNPPPPPLAPLPSSGGGSGEGLKRDGGSPSPPPPGSHPTSAGSRYAAPRAATLSGAA